MLKKPIRPLTFLVGSWLIFPSLTAANSGLWVGEVLVGSVSEVNKPRSDLSFDLRLEGTLVAEPEMPIVLVPAGAPDWRYSDAGDELPEIWREIGYGEPGWSTGAAQLGFGDGDERTVVSSGPDPAAKNPVTYFRKHFNVADPTIFSYLDISLLRDDGAVVYLNAQEVMRSNMPSGTVGYLTSPIEGVASDGENRFFMEQVSAAGLVAGDNVLAVEVHQHAAELSEFEGTAPPGPTASPLSLRLILHVDASGDVSLLKEVTQMWEDGTLSPDGTLVVPGRYVLITRDELIPRYSGVAPRDGSMVGRRLSAVGIDFVGDHVAMSGGLAVGSTASASLETPANHPTHPYRHRYHPDHDNLDATFEVAADEVGAITRTITLEVSGRFPPDPDQPERSPPPDWGTGVLGGIYRETITGIHRDPISVTGVFTLTRVSETEVLNE